VSAPFPELSRRFTQGMVNLYGEVNEDRNMIHYDAAAAHKIGFPAPLVHGAMVAALLSEACRAYFGPAWNTHGKLRVVFIKPLFVGQAAHTGGKPSADGKLLHVWARNDGGEDVVVAEAECAD
jgi:3-methylfumaryl-CoA hydratase